MAVCNIKPPVNQERSYRLTLLFTHAGSVCCNKTEGKTEAVAAPTPALGAAKSPSCDAGLLSTSVGIGKKRREFVCVPRNDAAARLARVCPSALRLTPTARSSARRHPETKPRLNTPLDESCAVRVCTPKLAGAPRSEVSLVVGHRAGIPNRTGVTTASGAGKAVRQGISSTGR